MSGYYNISDIIYILHEMSVFRWQLYN